MARDSRPERRNRRGCFVIALLAAIVLACMAYIGFRAGPISYWDSVIPTMGSHEAGG